MDCRELLSDPDTVQTHAVLQALCSKGIKPKNGVPKATHQHVEYTTGLSRPEVYAEYDELEDLGFLSVEYDARKISEITGLPDRYVVIFETKECRCPRTGGEALASHPEGPRTANLLNGSEGGAGSGTEVRGTEGAYREHARVPREEPVSPEPSKGSSGRRSQRRYENLEVRRIEPPAYTKHPSKMNAHDLAWEFREGIIASPHTRGLVVQAVNFNLLRKNLAQWRREGTKSEVIYEMIQIFLRDPRRWSGKNAPPAWKCFLADRQGLLNKAINAAKAKHRTDGGWNPEEIRKSAEAKREQRGGKTFEELREELIRQREARG